VPLTIRIHFCNYLIDNKFRPQLSILNRLWVARNNALYYHTCGPQFLVEIEFRLDFVLRYLVVDTHLIIAKIITEESRGFHTGGFNHGTV
jgi:hypothetical protein